MNKRSGNRRIAYFPEKDNNNAYVDRMKKLLSYSGEIERIPSLKLALIRMLKFDFSTYDIVWFNFIDNEFITEKGNVNYFKTIKIFIKTLIINSLSNKSIFVRHNHYPHKTCADDRKKLRKLIDWYERLFDVVISHSGAEEKGGRFYCPHPLYDLVEPQKKPSIEIVIPDNYFVFFGRIVPYKKLESLIENFPDSQVLLIIGSVGDREYAEKLQRMVLLKKNILFHPGYIEDEAAQYLISNSQGMVISHADDDMVVSGSFFYSMSVNKKVFAVKTDFLSWVNPIVGDNLLQVEDTLQSLCSVIKECSISETEVSSREIIVNNFGDDAVRARIEKVLEE